MILNKFSFGSDCENLVVYEGAEAIYKIMANIGVKFLPQLVTFWERVFFFRVGK